MNAFRWLTVTALLWTAFPGPSAAQQEGIRLDFQDVELRLVIAALADAGNLNVVYADLPPRRVTLRMNQPVTRDQILPLLRSIVVTNGLQLVQDGSLLRIQSGEMAAAALEEDTAAAPRMFVYRLKHARAAALATTLQAMFGLGLQPSFERPRRPSLSTQLRNQQVPPEDIFVETQPEVSVQLGDVTQPGLPARLSGEVVIVPDEPTNSLLVRARPRDWEIVETTIQALDLRPLQVLIEVMIAEVRRTSDLSVGVTGTVTRDGATRVEGQLDGISTGDVALNLMRAGRVSIDATLAALSRNGEVRILSRPVILAQNNQEATILVGAERPFIQVFRSLPTETAVRDQIVQYRDVGTTVTIIPTINQDGYVNLQVTQGVSTATAEEQFGAPVISTREASTQLFVRDGQTVVIGGLIDQQEQRSRSGIPILKDIPILGLLFGSTQRSTAQSELFIFLTPHVIATDDDADRVHDDVRGQAGLLDTLPGMRRDSVPPSRQER